MVTQFSLERPYFEKWDHWLRVFVPLGVERENKNISVALVKLNVKKKKAVALPLIFRLFGQQTCLLKFKHTADKRQVNANSFDSCDSPRCGLS